MVSTSRIITLAAALTLGLAVGTARAQDEHGHHGMKQVQQVKGAVSAKAKQIPNVVSSMAYPLSKCLVSGEELGGMEKPISFDYEGREIKFCCKGCVPKFEANPETYLKKLDQAIIDAQVAHYPLTKCPVSGESLDAMGKPFDLVVDNRLVRLCCKGCVKKVEADPKKVLAQIDQAVAAAQLPTYPLETCVVSGEELGGMGDTINYVYGTTLVRLCCKGCIRRFEAEPQKYLAKLTAAYKESMPHGVEQGLGGMAGKTMGGHGEHDHGEVKGTGHDHDGGVKQVSTGGSCGGCGGGGSGQ
jgi:YHS domain-containing protein